jgi:hypothetical protein
MLKNINEKNYTCHMVCSKETRHDIRTEVKKIFLEKNPDLENATDGILLKAMKLFYIAYRRDKP